MRIISLARAVAAAALIVTLANAGAEASTEVDAGRSKSTSSPTFTPNSLDDQWTLTSRNGVLNVTLVDAISKNLTIGPYINVRGRAWNDSFTAPLLVLSPGDTLNLRFINLLDQPTNLHFHGLRVSPKVGSDNVLMEIAEGKVFDFVVTIPADHPPGLYWYHSHMHLTSDAQVMNGMKGGLIIQGLLQPFPKLADVPSTAAILNDFYFDPTSTTANPVLPLSLSSMDPNKTTNRIVSGLFNPPSPCAPGPRGSSWWPTWARTFTTT